MKPLVRKPLDKQRAEHLINLLPHIKDRPYGKDKPYGVVTLYEIKDNEWVRKGYKFITYDQYKYKYHRVCYESYSLEDIFTIAEMNINDYQHLTNTIGNRGNKQ